LKDKCVALERLMQARNERRRFFNDQTYGFWPLITKLNSYICCVLVKTKGLQLPTGSREQALLSYEKL
jgi:hypothetical protein